MGKWVETEYYPNLKLTLINRYVNVLFSASNLPNSKFLLCFFHSTFDFLKGDLNDMDC